MKTFVKIAGLAIGCGVLIASLPARADVYFRDTDRPILRSYVATPAPASTGTVTYYAPGTALPETITYSELPTTVTTRLAPPPPGDKYVIVGRTAYLIEPENRVVIDAERLDEDERHEGVRVRHEDDEEHHDDDGD
jgi:hypothetical protein